MATKKEVTVRRTGVEKPCYGWDKAQSIEDRLIKRLDKKRKTVREIRVWRKDEVV